MGLPGILSKTIAEVARQAAGLTAAEREGSRADVDHRNLGWAP
jgi:hypothetical protein